MKDKKYILNVKNIYKFLFIFLIFTFSFLIFTSVSNIHAQEATEATQSSKVDYELSYPGLLPDHPLYFLKATRDRIISFFTSNPLKKARFNLLQADKRTQASYLLVDKGKIDLSQSTLSKAENYFEEAVDNTKEAKSQGIEVTDMARSLRLANIKHNEVFVDITRKLSAQDRKKFDVEKKRLADLGKEVEKISPKQ